MRFVPKTREEIRIAASLIGIRFDTVRQWFHRGAIDTRFDAPKLASAISRPSYAKSANASTQAAIAEKLDVSISSIKRARTIKATGATPVLEYEPAPAAAFAMLHLER